MPPQLEITNCDFSRPFTPLSALNSDFLATLTTFTMAVGRGHFFSAMLALEGYALMIGEREKKFESGRDQQEDIDLLSVWWQRLLKLPNRLAVLLLAVGLLSQGGSRAVATSQAG